MREYRRVPALENGSKLSNPDLQSIGEKNYTDIILRYGNLTTKFPQLNTNAKTVVAAINELYAHPGGSIVIPNPPIGSGVELEQGGPLELEQGGVLDTEQGGGTPVGDLTSISIDGDIYNIAGGGTTVVANPEDASSDKLIKLQVNDIIYSVPDIEPNSIAQSGGGVLDTLNINDATYMVSGFRGRQNITLYPNSWVSQSYGYSQTVSGLSLQNADIILVNPVNYDFLVYCECGIYCYSNTSDSLTFRCKTKPTNNVGVNIAYCKGVVS